MTDRARRAARPNAQSLHLHQLISRRVKEKNVAICQGCDRFPACRPDLPQWIAKKAVAQNLHLSVSALCNRAKRIGYVSPHRNVMPQGDQPMLCVRAHYYTLAAARATRRTARRRATHRPLRS